MLNQEQSDYIKSLKITHPNLDEVVIRQLLGGANWSEFEISEALSIYNDTYQAGQFVSSQREENNVTASINEVEKIIEKPEKVQASDNLNKQVTEADIKTEKELENDVKVDDENTPVVFDGAKKNLSNDKVVEKINEDFSADTNIMPQLDSEFKVVKGPDFGKEVDIEVNEENIKEVSDVSAKKPLNLIIIVLLAVALLGCLAGILYVAYQQISGGSAVQLNNNNILSTTLSKIAQIESAAYKVEFGASVNEREASARSIEEVFVFDQEEMAMLSRDKKRVDDVSDILSELKRHSYILNLEESENTFPETLDFLSVSSTDPFGQPYLYELAETEEGFNLTVEFETNEAVQSISKLDYRESIVIDGRKITFNKNSYVAKYFFDGKPNYPKIVEPFAYGAQNLEGMIDYDTKLLFAVDGGFDRSIKNSADVKFGVAGELSFGDAMFAVEAEFRKKAEDYYFIAKKFPAFFGDLNAYKGKWIHFTEADLREEVGISSLEDIEEFAGELNNDNQSATADFQSQFEEIIRTADKHSVFTIESANQVVIDDRELTEYRLRLSRDNILAFYEDISTKLSSYDNPLITRDERLIEELKRDDSALAFEYINENITFSLFYDKKGFPVRYQVDIRYVPIGDAVNIKDKQVNVVFSNTFSNINKKTEVEVPSEYIEVKEIMEEMNQYNNNIFLKDNTIFRYVSGTLR